MNNKVDYITLALLKDEDSRNKLQHNGFLVGNTEFVPKLRNLFGNEETKTISLMIAQCYAPETSIRIAAANAHVTSTSCCTIS